MQKKELIRNLMYFLSGVITIVIVLVVAFVLDTKDGKVIPLNIPRFFGDIKVWVERAPANQEKDYNISKAIYMAKDGKPFFIIDMNNAGKIISLSLLEGESIRFTMTASDEPGKWERGIYGGDGYGYTTGESYVDINFDGHFDVKHVFDNAGKKIASEIYVDGIWQRVDSGNLQKAISGQTTYIFDPNLGWCKQSK